MADEVAQLVVRLEARTRAAEREIEKFRRKAAREMGGVDKKVRDTGGVFERLAKKIDGAKLGVGLAAVAAGFVAGAKKAVDYADSLDKMAISANVGVERLQSLRFAADQSGAGADFVTQGLERLNRRLGEFTASGAGPAKDALEALGLAGDVTSGKLQAGEPAFDAILERLDGITNESEKAALAAKLFGDDAGPRMLRLLSQGSEGVRELEEQFSALGATISEETIKEVVAVRDEITALSTQITGQLTNAILSGIGKMIDFAQSIGMVSNAIGKVGEARIVGLKADLAQIDSTLKEARETLSAVPSGGVLGALGYRAAEREYEQNRVNRLEEERLKILEQIESVQKSISATSVSPSLIPSKPSVRMYDYDAAREEMIRGVADAEREYKIAAKASDSAVKGTVESARSLLRVNRENAELQIAFRDARQSALDNGATYDQAKEIGNLAKRQVQFRQEEQYELERLTEIERQRVDAAREAGRLRVEDIRAREDAERQAERTAREQDRETARIARETQQARRDAERTAAGERRDEIRETARIARETQQALRDAERAAEAERREAAKARQALAKEELDQAKAVGDSLINHMLADLAFRDAQADGIEKSAEATRKLQEETDRASAALAQGFAQAIAQADSFEDALKRIGVQLLEIAAQGFFEGLSGGPSPGKGGGFLGELAGSLGSAIFGGLPSFDGGGRTGGGMRTGGVDGRGGFPAILHPNETVIDHTRGGAGMSGGDTFVYSPTFDARGAGPREIDTLRHEMRESERLLPQKFAEMRARGRI